MRQRPVSFLNNMQEIQKSGDRLPHWEQETVPCFVTWRLADSLPHALLRRFTIERAIWLQANPKPWDTDAEEEYFNRFSQGIDRYLDRGMGDCLLRDGGIRAVVEGALRFREGQGYNLFSYVIMPNHVHVLFQLAPGCALTNAIKSWKGYSAHQINAMAGRSGSLWQPNYWDRLIRSPAHFRRVIRYIEENPKMAGLREEEYSLWTQEGLRERVREWCLGNRVG